MLNMDQLSHRGHWQHLYTSVYRYSGQTGAFLSWNDPKITYRFSSVIRRHIGLGRFRVSCIFLHNCDTDTSTMAQRQYDIETVI